LLHFGVLFSTQRDALHVVGRLLKQKRPLFDLPLEDFPSASEGLPISVGFNAATTRQ